MDLERVSSIAVCMLRKRNGSKKFQEDIKAYLLNTVHLFALVKKEKKDRNAHVKTTSLKSLLTFFIAKLEKSYPGNTKRSQEMAMILVLYQGGCLMLMFYHFSFALGNKIDKI